MTRIPLRRQLVLIAVVSIFPLAALSAFGLAAIYERQLATEQQRTLDLTRALGTAVDAELKRSISALQVIAAATEQDDLDVASFNELSRRVMPGQSTWRSLVLADSTGKQVAHSRFAKGSAIPPSPDPESVAATVASGKPQVGKMVQGPAGWGFAVRVPVMKQGRVHYVVSAILSPEPIAAVLRSQKLGDDGVSSVFDANGRRVARSRDHEKYLGGRGSDSLMALLATGKPEGAGVTRTLDGGDLFTAYTRTGGPGWVVVMGLPQGLLHTQAWRSTAIYTGALLLSILAGLLAAFTIAARINHPMSALRDAARVVGEGGQPASIDTPLREIQEVGDALQAAARDRHAAEAAREELLQREQQARGDAEAANRAKDQFLAMLGHELRNPIAAISNATHVMDMSSSPEATLKSREIIKRQVAHLARLTDDLLDAARAVLGKIELRPQPLDLAVVATHALASLSASGRGGRHRITSELGEAWVNGDPVRLEQVISNLLVNAVKYTPEGGRISIATVREGALCSIRVTDDGHGLPAELAARAFDLFVQGRRAIDRSQGGLGIGLTLVRRLAELHGGLADVHSDGENLGSTFTVRIPAIERPASLASSPAPALPGTRTVLIIEDNEDARDSLEALLKALGHRVAVAGDGVTGLETALALAPDLAIVDLGLPGLDGFEIARRLRSLAAMNGTYLAALTGYGGEDDRARALAAGFDAHITKPVSLESLQALLARTKQAFTTT